MVEASTAETLAFIVKIVNESLTETEEYRNDSSGESKYLQLASAEGPSIYTELWDVVLTAM